MIGLGAVTTSKWIRTREVVGSHGEVFYARHRFLGTDVLVHLMPATARTLFESLMAKVGTLPAKERSQFLDAGVRSGGYFIVTVAEPYYEDLTRLLDRVTSPVCLDRTSVLA